MTTRHLPGRSSWASLVALLVAGGTFAAAPAARADEATVQLGARSSFAEPPDDDPRARRTPIAPIAVDDLPDRPLRASSVRLQLGPTAVTTGQGLGLGFGVAADLGSGSVGARLGAAWVRGEGRRDDGSQAATGDGVGLYTGELTVDLARRGRLHPILGAGVGLLHVSRADASGFAGVGVGRLALEYALGLEDADARLGLSLGGGMIGPVDDDVSQLRGYAQLGAHFAIGF